MFYFITSLITSETLSSILRSNGRYIFYLVSCLIFTYSIIPYPRANVRSPLLAYSYMTELPSHSQVQLLKMWDAILSKTPDRAKEMSLETADFMLQYFTRCFSLEAEYQADNVCPCYSRPNSL